jgi:hypothetical protein
MTGRNVELAEGFRIWQAYYCLRGGITAQRKSYETRTKQYVSRYHFHFSENTIDNLSSVSYRHKTLQTEYIPAQPHAALGGDEGPESEEETVLHQPRPEKTEVIELLAHEVQSTQESLPDSEFAVNFRCGVTGDGNIVYHQEDGEVVQCDDCREWSHIGCQLYGRASNLSPKDPFHCDNCDPLLFGVFSLANVLQHPRK